MSKYIKYLLLTTLVMFFGSSAMAAQSTPDVPVSKELMAKARQKVLAQAKPNVKGVNDYVVGVGDILSVQVYGEGDMSTETPSVARNDVMEDSPRSGVGGVTVRMDGKISLKHIGDVDAVGFTLAQLADYLKIIFSTVYENPVVTVVLAQSNSQRYTVMGKVVKPGIFFIDYPIDLVQVIARCGGFGEWANSEITVVRKDARSTLFENNTLEFDYDDFLKGKEIDKNVVIKAGDIIIVH